MRDFSVFQDIIALLLPAFDLLNTASWIFIQRNIVLLNQIRAVFFYKERIVLRVVFAGFRTVIAQTVNVLIADHIMVFFGRGFCGLIFLDRAAADFRIKVIAVSVADIEKPAHMINSGD